MPNKEKTNEVCNNCQEVYGATEDDYGLCGECMLSNTINNKIDEEFDKKFMEYSIENENTLIDNDTDGNDIKSFIHKAIKQREEEIKNDLIKIADKGEYEDLRRECENYFS